MKAITTQKGKLKGSSGTLGVLKIPLVGLQVSVPISLDLYPVGDWEDPLDEDALVAAYEAKVAMIAPKLAAEVQVALTAALKSSSWTWRDGARDIYDTGALANSVNIDVTSKGIEVSYSAPYASIIHNGGYIQPYGNASARPIYLPPRPWISSVLYGGGPVPQFDLAGFIQRELG